VREAFVPLTAQRAGPPHRDGARILPNGVGHREPFPHAGTRSYCLSLIRTAARSASACEFCGTALLFSSGRSRASGVLSSGGGGSREHVERKWSHRLGAAGRLSRQYAHRRMDTTNNDQTAPLAYPEESTRVLFSMFVVSEDPIPALAALTAPPRRRPAPDDLHAYDLARVAFEVDDADERAGRLNAELGAALDLLESTGVDRDALHSSSVDVRAYWTLGSGAHTIDARSIARLAAVGAQVWIDAD
jgi:hypothetical protein